MSSETTSVPASAEPRKRRASGVAGASEAERATIAIVLERLSDRSGRKYKPATKQHAQRILRLLRDGYSENDLRLVVWDRANRWAADPKMDEFLRPATLFGPEKFADYLAEAEAADADDRQREVKHAQLVPVRFDDLDEATS